MENGKAKILIVDDDAHLRETLTDLLEMEGYEIACAATGQEAMNMTASCFYDVILMDFNLTDRTGIEVIKDIRRFNQESQILMMTGHASLDTAVKAIQESVYDFLIKPVDVNNLKRGIKKALEKLTLEQDVKKLVEELKDKNNELSHLNEMKSKFLSMSSHDLSNSLMTLQLSFDMLVQSLNPDPVQAKTIQFIKSGISQISRLITDLVDWASIEKGKFRLEKNLFELDKLVEEIVEGPRVRAQQKGITIKTTFSGTSMVCADKKRIGQVLMNLLENAIRYTPRGGEIVVTIAPQEGDVRAAVKDSGEGIDPDELKKLFRSFYQGDNEKKQKGRLGLGLSISKEIVLSHNGKIWVESEGIGKGATFVFTLPAAENGESTQIKTA